jgi:GntR family transcriptional regulator
MPGKTVLDELLTIRIDKASPTPVYAQIADAMTLSLGSGAVTARVALPPERVLCERLGVSRMTLRQAYDVLARQGLVESERGRGTFVVPKRMQKQQQEMRSFTEEIVARGAKPSSKLVAFRTVKQSFEDREFFGLPDGEGLYEIERVRFADGAPVAVEMVHIPEYLCPNLDRFNLVTQSLYRILEENYQLVLSHCKEEISAARPNRAQRKLLSIPASAAVLVVKRRGYTERDTPVELGITSYRGDMYTAIVRSVRRSK